MIKFILKFAVGMTAAAAILSGVFAFFNINRKNKEYFFDQEEESQEEADESKGEDEEDEGSEPKPEG